MKAVVIKEYGGPEVLVVEEVLKPTIKEDEVLIQVKAAGINRPHIIQRQGKYPAPVGVVQNIPGLEVSGVVVEKGNNVQNIEIGDRVIALVSGGGYAEYVNAHFGSVIPMPIGLSYEDGAALPETIYTVWHNLFQRGNLKAGQSVLIHGGAGGIGATAIQMSKLYGAKVITTVSTKEKEDFVLSLGVDLVINYRTTSFDEFLQGYQVDVVLDFVGGEYFNRNINVLKEDGHLIYINAMKGAKVELNLLKMMQKRLTITGSTLRNRSSDFKMELTDQIVKKVLPFIEEGNLKANIYKEFAFNDASKAHELMESGDFLGKLVLVF
ncbi:NAD(P)H-quinone oxidoreductase [Sphingobacterium bovistauri]|uniref:NAD(P)H-quinone oxidoreductase n=1 Tax=Sphingobacterium bovistauri TaxID=2781959 RepID=A0ABS7Z444_9SPHI|nr:NAD(P)H-quinone oxidoreductase [Sphingobacterium bovistauri]MCA5003655.1 NAD(P)H-quinone oxidoreductase [Sphingobacterium bovistauri]